MNQALGFGFLLAGGVMLTKALTGSSFGDVLQGHGGPVPTTGDNLLNSVTNNGVGGVGTAIANAAASNPAGTGSYVNPIPGATLGRTDQGVDANLRPGDPIVAIGDSKVIGIIHNWYSGQPFVWLQLLNGPNAGQYYYVAEQITPAVSPGQTVKAGQPIGTYSSSGTGLELGWATSSGETLAQATTGYVEGQVTQAGQSFRSFLSSLGLL